MSGPRTQHVLGNVKDSCRFAAEFECSNAVSAFESCVVAGIACTDVVPLSKGMVFDERPGTGRHKHALSFVVACVIGFRHCVWPFLAMLLVSGQVFTQDFGRRERQYDVRHYDIRVRLDEAARTVHGDVRIHLQPLRDTISRIVLDAVNMRIDSVFVGDAPAAYEYDSLKLRVGSGRVYRYGEDVSVRVLYSCVPTRGLYFIKPDESFPRDARQIWTQGQGEDNRFWIPCYDFPNDKATSEVRITVDTALRVLSNGRLIEHRDNGDGSGTWHWSQELPHSSYLIMLAAGRYRVYEDERDGIPVHSWHYEDDNPEDVRRTCSATAEMLRFFSEFIGLRYPWVKYTQVPVAHFPYGGMENTTATVLADSRFIVDSRAALDYDPEPLIAHELVHQWWGNYVTYIDWNNEWLNEGFATYYQQRWTLHRHGRDAFDFQRWKGINSYLDWTDKAGRLPVVHVGRTSSANTYSKGAAVLHMLNDILGESQFQRVMLRYIQRFALANVETNDLKRVIEDETGINLHWFFDQWLYKAGYPELEITRRITDGGMHVRIRQTQRIDSLCGVFRLPLTVALQEADGGERRIRVELTTSDTTLWVPMRNGETVMTVDPDNILCGRVSVDYSIEELDALTRSPYLAVSMRALHALGERLHEPGVWSSLAIAARQDGRAEIRKQALARLIDNERGLVNNAVEAKRLLLDLRLDAVSGVRATSYNGLRRFSSEIPRDVFIEGLSDSSYYVEAAAMNCLLEADTAGAWPFLRERLLSNSHSDILSLAALDWLGTFRHEEAQRIARTLAGPGHSLALRSKAFEKLLEMNMHPDTIRTLLLRAIDEPRMWIRYYFISALSVLGQAEARRHAARRYVVETDPRVRDLIRERYGLPRE